MNDKQNFSYSKLATYLECPKQYELQVLRNLAPFKDNIYTTFGSSVHKAIQMAIEKKYNIEESLFIFEKEFKEHLKQMDPHEAQLIFISEYAKKAKQILEYWYEEFGNKINSGEIEVLGVEKYFSYEILPNIFYNGIIDFLIKYRNKKKETIKVPTIKLLKSGKEKTVIKTMMTEKVETLYKIIDWKTGSVKPKENLQLLSYTVPMLFLNNLIINNIEYVYLKYKRKINFLIDDKKIIETKNKIISIINNIIEDTKNNTFKMCIDDKKCRFCNVKKFCDIDFQKKLDLNKSKE